MPDPTIKDDPDTFLAEAATLFARQQELQGQTIAVNEQIRSLRIRYAAATGYRGLHPVEFHKLATAMKVSE